jgi:transposase-like protein
MDNKLKPCPFCNSKHVNINRAIIHGQTLFYGKCSDCGSKAEYYDDTKAEALDTWQRGYITSE